MKLFLAIAFLVWLAVALSASRAAPSEIVKASYTGKVTSFGTFQSYGTWGPTNHTYMIITTQDHSGGLTEVRIVGNWTLNRFKVGDRVVKQAGESRPRIQPPT